MIPEVFQLAGLSGWMFDPQALPEIRMGGRPVPYRARFAWSDALDSRTLHEKLSALSSPLVLFAWSLGALAALRLALNPPANLVALVLHGATARLLADPRANYAGVDPATLVAMRRRIRRDPEGVYRDFFRRCHHPLTAGPGGEEVFVRQALRTDPALAQAGLDFLADTDVREGVREISLPLALFHGEQDTVVPPAQALWIGTTCPGATVTLQPHAGHALSCRSIDVKDGWCTGPRPGGKGTVTGR